MKPSSNSPQTDGAVISLQSGVDALWAADRSGVVRTGNLTVRQGLGRVS